MKKYLLTWYGITDLRASLGFEESDGPLLGALKSGDYTDVIILGYTNSSKQDPSIQEIEKPTDEWKIIDQYSNTQSGHKKWTL